MALNRSKVLETAQKYLAKGNLDKAIAEYRRLVEDDPRDVRTLLKIGDIYTRKGSRGEACQTYQQVAAQYAEQGFFLKAVAVFKQILKLDPGRLDVQLALADMYEQLQLVSDALNTYEMVAASYARAGDIERALETLGKMADLDPQNIPVRIKLAEALSKANRTDEAAAAFAAGAELLREQGRIDDYIKVAERLLYHKPADVRVARELSEIYIERQDPKRALAKLQTCFKADPRDTGTLDLLARAFEQLGQIPKAVSVYREIARVHQDAGNLEARATVLARILELDPGDAEARRALAGYAPAPRKPSGPPPSAIIEPEPEIVQTADLEVLDADDAELLEADDLLDAEEDDILIVDDEPAELRAPPRRAPTPTAAEPELAPQEPPARAPPRRQPSQPASPATATIPPDIAREAQIARLLTECEVFARYGLRQKVVEQLHKVLDVAPDHVEAREKLKNVYLEQGKIDEAVGQLYALADLYVHLQPELAAGYLQQVLDMNPGAEPASSRLAALFGGPAPSGPEPEDEVLFVDEPTTDEGLQTGPGLPPMDELGAPGRAPAPETVGGPAAPTRGLAPMSPEEFEAAPLRPSRPGDLQAARQRVSLPPGEIEEILDEAEFFLAQGLLDEARGTLRDALAAHPDHMLLRDKIAEIEELRAAAAASAPPDALSAEDESFLLAEKLAEELGPEVDRTEAGSDVLDVESVFAQFKKGVAEQIGIEDSDTHFDLGIAYKEMGLLEDAVHEFSLAKTNPQRECIAFTMMGLCYVEKGEIADAIAHFKKGLYAEHKTDREELGLYFELGTAYELLHDPKEALYYYQKVQKREPDFRAVGDRIKQLTSTKARAAALSAPDVQVDDVDRAFDDLLGDD